MAFFPAGKHDDQVDALSYAITLVSRQYCDWDYAYCIYRCQSPQCKAINHGYRLDPRDRRCPRCGTPPDPERSAWLFR